MAWAFVPIKSSFFLTRFFHFSAYSWGIMMVLVACKVIYGAIFCYNFCHFLKKLRNSICYGHFWAAHGVMSIGVYLRLPVHRNSMKHQGHTKIISSFAFTLSILANCDTKITILACFNRFTIDRKFQRCRGGS